MMMPWQVYIYCRAQVMKIMIPVPLKEIRKTTPHAQSVALGMVIVWRNGFVVMGATSGTIKSVQA